jgi:hypothetical protein
VISPSGGEGKAGLGGGGRDRKEDCVIVIAEDDREAVGDERGGELNEAPSEPLATPADEGLTLDNGFKSLDTYQKWTQRSRTCEASSRIRSLFGTQTSHSLSRLPS